MHDWFYGDHSKPFILKGYAGTGKSTLVNSAIAALGLDQSEVCFGAYTGKAASVLRRKGNPSASTVHRLIYKTIVKEIKIPILDRHGKPMVDELGNVIFKMTQAFEVIINPESPVISADLVVIDEGSMIGQDMYDDLMSFGVPVIMIGDPGQLPPIGGKSPFDSLATDHLLTEVLRQALDSPIIAMATGARFGRSLGDSITTPHGSIWRGSAKANLNSFLTRTDQWITGKRDTRAQLNDRLRTQHGHGMLDYPTKAGAKIICRKNMHDIGVMNGEIGHTCDGIGDNEYTIEANVIMECTTDPISLTISKQKFIDPDHYDRNRGIAQFEWGYAITCHMSQGSEWDDVIIVDDQMQRFNRDIRSRWLYTAITRASKNLVFLDAPGGI